MNWRGLAVKVGKWLLRKAAEDTLKELDKRKEQAK